MSQSLSQIYLHLVFSTKKRERTIPSGVRPQLHAYLAGVGNSIECPVIEAGGTADHVHLLLRLHRTIAPADAVRTIKAASSKWMKEDAGHSDSSWQTGYGIFSVSASHVDDVVAYIQNQEEHHRTRTFQEEFRLLLERYGVEYNEAYVWD